MTSWFLQCLLDLDVIIYTIISSAIPYIIWFVLIFSWAEWAEISVYLILWTMLLVSTDLTCLFVSTSELIFLYGLIFEFF